MSLSSRSRTFRERWKRYRTLVVALGIAGAVKYVLWKSGIVLWKELRIRPVGIEHPLVIRRSATDVYVFDAIFLNREYACIGDVGEIGLVIDCGANVGYSAAYFLNRFPECRVVAIEPDASNVAVLRANLESYGGRVRLLHAGIWNKCCGLRMSSDSYRDGGEWARQVRVCAEGEKADIEAVDMASVIAASGFERVSLLKVDIEGAEAVLFSGDCSAWLSKVDRIVIELHDDSCFGNASETFFSAINPCDFVVSRSGELTVCRRSGLD